MAVSWRNGAFTLALACASERSAIKMTISGLDTLVALPLPAGATRRCEVSAAPPIMRISFKLLIGCLFLIALGQSAGANLSRGEAAVKGTFIVKFISYIDWPEATLRSGQPITLCVIGADPFGEVLNNAASQQQSRGRQIVIRRLSSLSQINACHVAYVGGPAREVTSALSAVRGKPIVTITDARVSTTKGILHFQVVAGKVKFDINAAAAKRSGVTISSHLLGLARVVQSE